MGEIPSSDQGKVEFTGGLANINEAFDAKYAHPEASVEAPAESAPTVNASVEQDDEYRIDYAKADWAHQEDRAEAARDQIAELAASSETDTAPEIDNTDEIIDQMHLIDWLDKVDQSGDLPQGIYNLAVQEEDRLIEQFKGVESGADRDANILAQNNEIWLNTILPAIEAADAQVTPENTAERTFTPERLAELSRSTVEMYLNADMTSAQKKEYLQAAAAKGIPISGRALESSNGGWQAITERPENESKFSSTVNTGKMTSSETLSFKDVAEGYSKGSEDDPNVSVNYSVNIKGGGNPWTPDAIGTGYYDKTGRPGRSLQVSFDLPRSAAEFLAKQAESDPASVRKAIEAIVLETGMPPDAWGMAKVNSNDKIRPNYEEPKDGYRIGVSGGDKVGTEDYEQQL